MAEGHGQDAWGRASCLLSMLANINRDPKKTPPFTPDKFNPYKQPKRNVVSSLEGARAEFMRGMSMGLGPK